MKRATKVLAVLLSTVMAVTAMPVKNVSAGVISEVKTGYVAQAECVFAIDNKNISELTKDDEYKVRDAFYSLDDSGINRACSEHFQIIWGNNGTNSGRVNEEFVAGNLTNLENIWAFYVYGLEMEEPGISENESLRNVKYKTNLYISSTGLNDKVADDWAYMSVDSGSFGFMCLEVDAMRVDEPSWVVPHELAHVFTYHQGGAVAYEWYEATANWFRDQYLGSYYYAYNNNHYGPTSDFFAPFMLNSSYYFPHIRNWYDAWPILLYISENPDNIDGLGMEFMHKFFENKQIDDTIFATIERLSGVSIKTILGNMTRRLATMDFDRQEHYLGRLNETLSYDSSNYDKIYTSLQSADGYGYQTVPEDRVPMQCGFNIIPLNADLSAKNLKIDFVNTSSEAGADFRVSLVTKCADNTTRYSEMINGGETKIELNGDETQAYLVVCATPDELKALEIGDENTVSTRYSYKVRVWTDNESSSENPPAAVTDIKLNAKELNDLGIETGNINGAVYAGFSYTDTSNKMVIEANNQTFGTADDRTAYTYRLKTGGKSGTANYIEFETNGPVKLSISARSGSSSSTRRICIGTSLNDTSVFSQSLSDSDAITVNLSGSDLKVFPTYVAEISSAGTYYITYPDGGISIYEISVITDDVTVKNGLIYDSTDGKWYYYTDDAVDTAKTGLVQGSDDVFWYVNAGVVDTSYTGFITNAAGTWYVAAGKVDTGFTGLGKDGDNWIPVFKGKAYPDFTGIIQNAGYFWYVKDGTLDTTYTGFYENENGKWYVANGKVDTSFKGLGQDGDQWLVVLGGKHSSTYTGLIQNGGAFWYVKNGVLDTTFTGITQTGGASWLVATGKLCDDYNGTYTDGTVTYTIVNGKVTE